MYVMYCLTIYYYYLLNNETHTSKTFYLVSEIEHRALQENSYDVRNNNGNKHEHRYISILNPKVQISHGINL